MCSKKVELVKQLGIEKSVTFLGKVPHSEVMKSMALSDIYVIPSLRESWGISPMEAMAMSIPVIGIDNGGLSEVLDSESSILIKPQSPEQVTDELTCAIKKLAADNSLCQTMGAAGRKRVVDVFSWEKTAKDLEKIYESAVKGQMTLTKNSELLAGPHSQLKVTH